MNGPFDSRVTDALAQGRQVGQVGEVASLYICYWSLGDPLCQSQCLPYLRGLAAHGYRAALITYEQRGYRLARPDRDAARARLAGEGILWHPLPYHKRPSLVATGYDYARGVALGVACVRRYRPSIVHGRASVAAAIALGIACVTGTRFLYDADSRLSEEYADNGHWRRTGFAYRLLAAAESRCRRRADAIVVLSDRLRRQLIEEGATGPIDVIPCCVDGARIGLGQGRDRDARRAEIGVGREFLFVYAGKIGPRYLIDRVAALVRLARERLGAVRLLVLSHDAPERFHAIAGRAGLAPGEVIVRAVAAGEVGTWLEAADAGLALIRPAGCERGSAPIKIGEYLAAGLPVVVTAGIGDYSDAIERERVGVTLADTSDAGLAAGAGRLAELCDDRAGVCERARAFVRAHLDLSAVGVRRYVEVYRQLCGES